MNKATYLCLQATQQGQASYAHVHEIINGLKQRDWQVEFFEPAYAKADILPGPIGRLKEFIRVQLAMMRRATKTDVLYVRAHFAAFPIALWAKIKGIPVVQEVNGPYEDVFIAWPATRYISFFIKWLIRTQLKWADAVIVVTHQLKDWVIQETNQQEVHVIPNGANTNLFKPNAACVHAVPKSYVVFFGAFALWQGIDILIQAVQCPKWPESVKLLMIGDGAERLQVEEAAKQNSQVVYMGKLPYAELPGVIAGSIAGLSPQKNLGGRSTTGLFPLKVFETLACGVPAVVTDFPGQADLVRENKCGLVIPSDDPRALAEAVSYLYHNSSERESMGKNGHKIVVQEHSWEKRAEDTSSVLLGVLGKEQ